MLGSQSHTKGTENLGQYEPSVSCATGSTGAVALFSLTPTADRGLAVTDHPTEPTTDPEAGAVHWTTPPTDGGERLDGRSAALVSADRVLTGRRGQVEGSLETIGIRPSSPSEAEVVQARTAGQGGAVLLRGRHIVAVGTTADLEGRLAELLPDVDPQRRRTRGPARYHPHARAH